MPRKFIKMNCVKCDTGYRTTSNVMHTLCHRCRPHREACSHCARCGTLTGTKARLCNACDAMTPYDILAADRRPWSTMTRAMQEWQISFATAIVAVSEITEAESREIFPEAWIEIQAVIDRRTGANCVEVG